mmetsp:Transcript_19550/g.60713  ORF Transcript_19550/g.60713 Transcript_19550/m.60713 type:complete len:244 (+) Transcript_19550:61-792(+)
MAGVAGVVRPISSRSCSAPTVGVSARVSSSRKPRDAALRARLLVESSLWGACSNGAGRWHELAHARMASRRWAATSRVAASSSAASAANWSGSLSTPCSSRAAAAETPRRTAEASAPGSLATSPSLRMHQSRSSAACAAHSSAPVGRVSSSWWFVCSGLPCRAACRGDSFVVVWESATVSAEAPQPIVVSVVSLRWTPDHTNSVARSEFANERGILPSEATRFLARGVVGGRCRCSRSGGGRR